MTSFRSWYLFENESIQPELAARLAMLRAAQVNNSCSSVVPNTEHQQITTTMLKDVEGARNSEKEKTYRNMENDCSYGICYILFIS